MEIQAHPDTKKNAIDGAAAGIYFVTVSLRAECRVQGSAYEYLGDRFAVLFNYRRQRRRFDGRSVVGCSGGYHLRNDICINNSRQVDDQALLEKGLSDSKEDGTAS